MRLLSHYGVSNESQSIEGDCHRIYHEQCGNVHIHYIQSMRKKEQKKIENETKPHLMGGGCHLNEKENSNFPVLSGNDDQNRMIKRVVNCKRKRKKNHTHTDHKVLRKRESGSKKPTPL